jgi:hypothetical protein
LCAQRQQGDNRGRMWAEPPRRWCTQAMGSLVQMIGMEGKLGQVVGSAQLPTVRRGPQWVDGALNAQPSCGCTAVCSELQSCPGASNCTCAPL